jgi:hypothetical protein
MKSACFICGIPVHDFHRCGNGFEYHVSQEHNMWDYIFYILYLMEKDESEYTAQESYVAEQVAQRSTDFFPINRSLTIQENQREGTTFKS